MKRRAWASGLLVLSLAGFCACSADREESGSMPEPGAAAAELTAEYIERYFEHHPTRAVEAGRYDFAHRLEDWSPERLADWTRYNHDALGRLAALIDDPDLPFEHRLDLELIQRRARLTLFDLGRRDRSASDPLFWTRPIGNASVFLLVREDAPLEERLRGALARAEALPRLAEQARQALAGSAAAVSPEVAGLAARQARASAQFYGEGFARAGEGLAGDLPTSLAAAGRGAQKALGELAGFLDGLAETATGSPLLGADYGERFRLVTGETASLSELLAGADAALAAKRKETAAYGREVWAEVLGGDREPGPPPVDDAEVIRRLFARIGDDHASSVEEFVADYEELLAASVEFVRRNDVITLPEPLTVHTARSPDFFVGQSVGGVYPAGPFSPPDAKTLFYLPTPPASLTAEQRDGFFRDFNHHFNVMITPHEMVPGHYLQLKMAARHSRKVRALFGDGVYIEGWGTFCERLMLDLGWGGPADRLAHLKKQLENIARTLVDIRVHTEAMPREEVLRFVREEAFQEAQFASNMWTRAITSSPQLTSYYLGYSRVRGLYDEVRAARGDDFVLKEFMDAMMELGPVPVSRYRERLLGAPATS